MYCSQPPPQLHSKVLMIEAKVYLYYKAGYYLLNDRGFTGTNLLIVAGFELTLPFWRLGWYADVLLPLEGEIVAALHSL